MALIKRKWNISNFELCDLKWKNIGSVAKNELYEYTKNGNDSNFTIRECTYITVFTKK